MSRKIFVWSFLTTILAAARCPSFIIAARRMTRTSSERFLPLSVSYPDRLAEDTSTEWKNFERASSAKEAIRALDELKATGQVQLWNSSRLVGDRGRISDGELRMLTRLPDIMSRLGINGAPDEERSATALVVVMIASVGGALAVGNMDAIPGIVRFVLSWVLSFTPFAFLGWSVAKPDQLQRIIVKVNCALNPEVRQRMARHEAGHFLVGHLCGLPVSDYSANSIENAVQFWPLDDPERTKALRSVMGMRGESLAWADAEDSSGRPGSSLMNPRRVWPYRGVDPATTDLLAVVSMAGVMAEILEYGDAKGGYADFSQLQEILEYCDPPLDDAAKEDLVRWAALMANTVLRRHADAMEVLVTSVAEGRSVTACIQLLDSAHDPLTASETATAQEQRRKGREASLSFGTTLPRREDELYKPFIAEDDVLALAVLVTATFLTLVGSGALKI